MKTKNIVLILILGLFFIYCSKENKIKKKILGQWTIDYISRNDTDYTAYWKENYNLVFWFKDVEGYNYPMNQMIRVHGEIKNNGIWYNFSHDDVYIFIVSDKKDYIKFHTTSDILPNDPIFPDMFFLPLIDSLGTNSPTYLIQKLSKDELNIDLESDSISCNLHFIKKS